MDSVVQIYFWPHYFFYTSYILTLGKVHPTAWRKEIEKTQDMMLCVFCIYTILSIETLNPNLLKNSLRSSCAILAS